MTGGGRGMCGKSSSTVDLVYGGGYGYGRGKGYRRGGGRGWGRGAGPAFGGYGTLPTSNVGDPVSRSDESEMLQSNADAMQRTLTAIQGRIAELEK